MLNALHLRMPALDSAGPKRFKASGVVLRASKEGINALMYILASWEDREIERRLDDTTKYCT
jgi:hypothetical protein